MARVNCKWLWVACLVIGCGEADIIDPGAAVGGVGDPVQGKADASIDAVFLDFEFEGEFLASSAWRPEQQIEDQLLYTIGQLNGDNSLGRIDQVALTDVETEELQEGVLIRYHARLPVAWGRPNAVPSVYKLQLPRDMSRDAQAAFTEKYGHTCVDYAAHDVDVSSIWYYYRPARNGCDIAEGDVVVMEATVTNSTIHTTGKFPEYHKVWEDGTLEVLAIFGKFEHGATSSSDAGIRAYGEYVSSVQARLAPYEVQTTPSDLANKPGLEQPDATIEATLPDGRQVRVVVLLVDGVRSEGAAFDERYESLSTTADLIAYNGHSGLGANIRALANKGSWQAGQYVLVFMNGCDTYAYVDSALADAHIAVNPDDPEGTKYLDIITNAMPAPATFGPSNTMALTEALLEYETPSTYEMIFRRFNRSQVVLVSGEQDNVYYEGFEAGVTPAAWAGLSESGQVSAGQEVRLETPQLPAGDIRIQLSGTGDADLYVRVNEAPTTEVFDCRPYLVGSTEECTVTLEAPGSLHVLIRGYEALSDWTLAIH